MVMRKVFKTRISFTSVNFGLLILRLSAGGFMLTHGYPKLQRLLTGELKFSDPLGLGPEVSLVLVVLAEIFCSILIMLGLGTRLATLPLIVAMSVAAFIAHGSDPFARKELALMYLVSFVVLLLNGGGKYSVDHLLQKKK
jgi:putative oxidoreductase